MSNQHDPDAAYDDARTKRDDFVGEYLESIHITSDTPIYKSVMHVVGGVGTVVWESMTPTAKAFLVGSVVSAYFCGRTDERRL